MILKDRNKLDNSYAKIDESLITFDVNHSEFKIECPNEFP